MSGFAERNIGGVVLMTSPVIETAHGFTTRFGGVSRGIYESLNLGENRGDDPAAVRENYRRLRAALGIEGGMVFSKQVHKTDVRVARESDRREPFDPLPYEADGLITDVKGLPLIVFTADCVPVLLHDPVRGAAGAVHAGWRGALGDICGKAVRKMASEFGCRPENIRAAVGPAIGKCCFETDGDVPAAVDSLLGHRDGVVTEKGNGKYLVDLRAAVKETLVRAGARPENIDVSDECTVCRHDKYWSHRYTSGIRGSQAAVIML